MKKIILTAILVFSFCIGSESKCNSQSERLLFAISSNNCKVAKEIVNKNPKIIFETNEYGADNMEVLFTYYYVLANYDLWQDYDFNCFLDTLLQEKPNLNFYTQELNLTPLGIVAGLPISNKIEILDKLLKAGADIKQMPLKDSDMEILYFAIYNKDLNLMEYLLKNGAPTKDNFGRMIAEWLYDYKTENQTNDEIMKIVKSKEFIRDRKWALQSVDIFLKYADIKDFSDKDRLGSINSLTYFNDIEFVKKLVNLGIFDDKKELLEKAINYAKENRRFEIAEILENLKAKKGF
ncbi:ankyrin domain protein [Campylobacter ureolyticus RIGS 9880]|uniref:Ankyrin domain protein n=1 Tax=Campylobacter ureolyticus RIGS 9880 TaxID=1032069 RepID=A0AAU8U0X8_9BACT|nr:ankyrin repeat domain-containing protein [Campylobacter ureolyticus]AKT90166.1 ankyrin domain protein [Campylobacter ureolyticus RIGS 9880]